MHVDAFTPRHSCHFIHSHPSQAATATSHNFRRLFSPFLEEAVTLRRMNSQRLSVHMSAPLRRVFVVGVGMTKFEKPGARDWDYPDMVKEAGEAALADARINYKDVQQVVAGWVYGDSTAGQRAV
jgi:hypothetical protein